MPSKKELEGKRKLVDKIARVVSAQHHHFTEGQVRSLHKAYDWIAKTCAEAAEAEAKKVKDKKNNRSKAEKLATWS